MSPKLMMPLGTEPFSESLT